MQRTAIILSNGLLESTNAKTTHGLVRGDSRFEIKGIIDHVHAGKPIKTVIGGPLIDVPIVKDIATFIEQYNQVDYAIIGVAFHGGILPDSFRPTIVAAIQAGMSIVNGLHQLLIDDEEFLQLAQKHNVQLIDIRRPKKFNELSFWTGDIYNVKIPRVAILGMDCAMGKRTTAQLLRHLCQVNEISSEMVYTGQTGWLQGHRFGFIFDSTLNDFLCGELEKAILDCVTNAQPDIIFLEGQSGLRNPSGPTGSEFIISGQAKYVVLQHSPGRKLYEAAEEYGKEIPSVQSEIELIRMLGAEVIAITLNEEMLTDEEMLEAQFQLENSLSIPIIRPFEEGVDRLLPILQNIIKSN